MKSLTYLVSTFAISCILAAPTNDRPFNNNVRSLLRALSGDNAQQPSQPPAEAQQQPKAEEKKDSNSKPQDNTVKAGDDSKDAEKTFVKETVQAFETVLRALIDKKGEQPHSSQSGSLRRYNVKAPSSRDTDYDLGYDNEDDDEDIEFEHPTLKPVYDNEGDDDDYPERADESEDIEDDYNRYPANTVKSRNDDEDDYPVDDDDYPENDDDEDDYYSDVKNFRESSHSRWSKKMWI
ncbi:hypothetical protein CONCODRAFT_124289 [Conidiobolus coronatus NRRL 28638]|uniref:Uncharacterized protein n=1 Tax=Conidiobolus coronatus (strain ATCC 28846 / CBS 209.66 / NRRL 28638) TaxID=796925 RepID=A0A137NVW0_CONC2|nr:hypothetical protein CONCODRAFT_124289 [Conidiobolus coronatus NRRL 28638]|eukprot:KXN66769.1 hypothetical protein CONCODRAFT_124289 [Conidiobolus coronatus NRRL 28638]